MFNSTVTIGRFTMTRHLALILSTLFCLLSPSLVDSQVLESFPLPTPECLPSGITLGPDGNMWFIAESTNSIGRISWSGSVTEFVVPVAAAFSEWGKLNGGITSGPDGAIWFVMDAANRIGRFDTVAGFTSYEIPTPSSSPTGITLGPDGNLWFTESTGGNVGRITSAGQITEFPVPTTDFMREITSGPDGNLWYSGFQLVGRISTTGTVTEFPTGQFWNPTGIVWGPDDRVWFNLGCCYVGAITPAGVMDLYDSASSTTISDIASGPDGNLWISLGTELRTFASDGQILSTIPAIGYSRAFALGQNQSLWYTDLVYNSVVRMLFGNVVIFSDGFETGDTTGWSTSTQ